MLFGADYRAVWTTPATFEVLDLGSEGGGLTPVSRVGGQQSKVLAFKGRDGRNYTFRSLEKDASQILDEDLRGTIIDELFEDALAAQHPASEVVARGLLDATGIPCPPWRLVVLPDDPALGPFRKEFAGAVGDFADYPARSAHPTRASSASPRSSITSSSSGGCRRAGATRSTCRRCSGRGSWTSSWATGTGIESSGAGRGSRTARSGSPSRGS